MARHGENIHKRKDGRWEGRYISSRTLEGKAKYSSVYGKSYSEVKEKLFRRKINALDQSQNGCIKFSALLNLWLKVNTPRLKEATVIKYTNLIDKHIADELGDYKLSVINSAILNNFIDRKIKSGRIDGNGGISTSYARTIMIIIKSALVFGNEEKICSINLKNLYIPKPQIKKIEVLTSKEQSRLERYLFSNPDHSTIGVILALFTGMRIGELCALKWEDVDVSNKIIHINETLSAVKNSNGKGIHFEMKEPKTRHSKRDIPIPTRIIPVIKEVKSKAKSAYVISDKIDFTNPRTYEYRFHKIIKSSGVSDFNFHKLRHTFATRCVESGVDIKTLSEILGHSNVSITLNLYVHPSMKQKIKQINKLSKQIA